MNNTFTKAFAYCVTKIKNDKELSRGIEYLGLLGSVREKEAVLGYSDLDILLIIKTDKNGTIDFKIINKLNIINRKASKKYKKIPISFLTHSFNDFEKYVDFNYLTHYSWAKIVIGDEFEFKSRLHKIISVKKMSGKNLYDFIYKNLLHSRFNLFRKLASGNKDKIKLIIDNILEISAWLIVHRGVFLDNKKKNAVEFDEMYPNIIPQKFVLECSKLRDNWDNKKIPANFIEKSIEFVNNCIKEIDD